MKKNLITVIILAISIINLVFNILLVFVFMPSSKKTNKLITDIATVLDLELASKAGAGEGNEISINDIEAFTMEETSTINLAPSGDGKIHVVQYGVTINLNTKADDFDATKTNITNQTALVKDICRDAIGAYTYEQVSDVNVTQEIKSKILKNLQDTFGTECIVSVSFGSWVAQ